MLKAEPACLAAEGTCFSRYCIIASTIIRQAAESVTLTAVIPHKIYRIHKFTETWTLLDVLAEVNVPWLAAS